MARLKRKNRIDTVVVEPVITEPTEDAPYGYKKSGKAKKPPLKDREGWQKFKDVFPDIGAGIFDIAGNFIPGADSIADMIRGLDGPSEEDKAAALAYAKQLELDMFEAEVKDRDSARTMNTESLKSIDSFVRRFPYYLAAGVLLIAMVFMGLILFGGFIIVGDVSWMIVGTLMSGFTTILAFFFGSSIGSKMKDEKDNIFR